MNTLYHAEARIDDLRRSAEQRRLAIIAQVGQPSRSITLFKNGRRYLGQGLSWLGSRLREPVRQPIQPVAQCNPTGVGRPTLALSECP